MLHAKLSLASRGPSTHDETPRVHHATRRCGGGVAARCSRAAVSDACGWIPPQQFARRVCVKGGGIPTNPVGPASETCPRVNGRQRSPSSRREDERHSPLRRQSTTRGWACETPRSSPSRRADASRNPAADKFQPLRVVRERKPPSAGASYTQVRIWGSQWIGFRDQVSFREGA
jgi:hypothetical protein